MATLKNIPYHVAIIMDGNGRWAKLRHQQRIFGHKQGVKTISKVVKAAIQNKIKVLSLFAFSCENWERPKKEVDFLLKLLSDNLNEQTIKKLNENNIRLCWTGFKGQLSSNLLERILLIEAATKANTSLILNICFNYGGMQDILSACKKVNKSTTLESFNNLLLTKDLAPVDLLIRTGNEKRISNFFLWQIAYAEIIFEKTFWPAYTEKTFKKNLLEFSCRERRYGKLN